MNAEIQVNTSNPYKFWIVKSHLHYRYINKQINIEIYTGKEWINAQLCRVTGEESFSFPESEKLVHETSIPNGIYI